MNKGTYFHFRCSHEERDMIRELARIAARKDGEAMRVMVRGAYDALVKQERQENAKKSKVEA